MAQRLNNKGIEMAKYYKYDSGLVLLYENNKINRSTSIEIAFDCGSRCDGKLSGLAHFCEHMFFTGTDKLSRQEIAKRYLDFFKTNAFTNGSQIVFTGDILTSKLCDYLCAVQDMICNSTFKSKAVEDEKKVVIQEIARDIDKHSHKAGRILQYELYNLEHLKIGVLGTSESVNQITSKDVKNYVKKYFVKNNCVISICSPLSFRKVKNIIKKYFDDKMPSNNLKPLPYMANKLVDGEGVKVHHVGIDKNFFSVIFKSKREGPDLKYRVLMGAIGNIIDDISDGLTKELRLDNNLVYGMNADYMINNENSFFELSTEIGKENINPCLDIMINYINNIVKNGFTKEQLTKEQEKDNYYYQTRVKNPNEVQRNLTRYRFYGKFISNDEIHNQVQKLTLDEVNKAVVDLFKNSQIYVFVYGNANKSDVYTLKQIKNKFKL